MMRPAMKRPDLLCALAALAATVLVEAPLAASASTPAAPQYGTNQPAPPAAPAPGTAAATPASAPAPAAPAPPPPPPPAQLDYEAARAQVAKKKFDEALKTLDKCAADEGYSPALSLKARALRAEILLSKHKPDAAAAEDLMVQILHEDKEGAVFSDAAAAVKAKADEIRDTHPFVFHDALPVTRAGRPLKLHVRVADPGEKIDSVHLHLRAHALTEYSDTPMKRELTGWSFFLRQPEELAPEGVTDEYAIDYYYTGLDKNGDVIDSDGSPDQPIETLLSNTKATSLELASGVDLNAVTRAENAQPVVAPPPPPPTPWYLRWYTLAGAGAVVATVVVVSVVEGVQASHPPALPPHLGVVKFPLEQ
jgi:hypothetical protein